jgi:MFS family permease
MPRARVLFVVWAAFLALAAVVEWTIFTHHTPNYYLLVVLPAFAIGGTLVIALLSLLRERPRSPARPRIVADASMASALVGIALGVMLWGAFIGEWLLLIGAGLLALGFGGVLRELYLGRRLDRAAARIEREQPGRG